MTADSHEGTHAFAGFMLDTQRRRLIREGVEVPITAKPFDALVYLVERAGETVSRAELAQSLWPAVVVEDNNLSQTILALRRALGDSEGAPQFVLTVPRQGYRFVAEVTRGPRGAPVAKRPPRRFAAAAVIAGSLVLVAAAWVTWHAKSPPVPLDEPRTSPAAYAAFLKARELYQTQGGIGVSLAPQARAAMRAELDAALRDDPRYADALGWRAHVDLDTLLFDAIPASEWPERSAALLASAERQARASLAEDSHLGIAHTTLARLHMYRGRLDEARDALAAALASSPDDPMVLHYEAIVRTLRDEHDAAIAAARRALSREPRSPGPYSPLVLSLDAKGDTEGAAQAARQMIDVAPTAAIGYVVLARQQVGGGADATREARRAATMAEQFLGTLGNFRLDAALSYARIGDRAAAARLVTQFREAAGDRHVDAGLEAMALLALGNYDAAGERVDHVIHHRGDGMDPMTLLLIRRNAWSDPVLDSPAWRARRTALAAAETR